MRLRLSVVAWAIALAFVLGSCSTMVNLPAQNAELASKLSDAIRQANTNGTLDLTQVLGSDWDRLAIFRSCPR